MKKVLGLTIIAFFITSSAWAGDTFVRNDTVHRTNRTETSLDVDTITKSNRTEHYNSYSEKISFEGNSVNQAQSSLIQNNNFQQEFINNNSVLRLSNISLNDDNYAEIYNTNNPNGWTIHRSGSSLSGTFIEDINTRVTGTI